MLGPDIANWLGVLGDLKAKYGDLAIRVLPGHGAPSDPALFDRMRVYLDDFVSAVSSEATNAAAMDRMKRLYPGFEQEDFLLVHSGGVPRAGWESLGVESFGDSARAHAALSPTGPEVSGQARRVA